MNGHSERAHARLSPSFMDTALKCPLAIILKEKFGSNGTNLASEFGTKCHEASEIKLSNFLLFKQTGALPAVDITGMYADPEVKIIAETWRDLVWKNVFEQSITGKAWEIEGRLTYSEKYDLWGTSDLWLVATDDRAKRFGHIADLKTGRILIDINDNEQLPTYGVCLREEVRRLGKDLDYVICSIYQPLNDNPWQSRKFTAKQLDKHEAKLKKLIEQVYLSSTPPKAKLNDKCIYCPGQAGCTVYAAKNQKDTALAFVDPTDFKFPDVAVIPDETLIKIALNEKALIKFIKAPKKLLLSRMYNGEKIENVKLVESKGKRYIDENKKDLIVKELSALGLNAFEQKLKGRTQLIQEITPIKNGKIAKELVDKFSSEPKSGVSLVHISDKRPELDKSPEALFDDEDGDNE